MEEMRGGADLEESYVRSKQRQLVEIESKEILGMIFTIWHLNDNIK
jgi:hypothetical protein